MLPALTLLAALSGSFAFSDRTEARVRDPGIDPNKASVDYETAPIGRVILSSRRTRYTLEYAPRLSFFDTNIMGVHPVFLNSGALRVEWHTKRVRLSLGENVSYGEQNFSSLVTPTATPTDANAAGNPAPSAPPTTAGVQPIPKPDTILFASSTTILSSGISFRRWALDMSVGYQLSGGLNDKAKTLLPLQKGPFATASADYGLTKFDRLATTVAASELEFSNGPESIVVEANEAWRRMWARYTDTRLAVGIAGVRAKTETNGEHKTNAKPVAEFSIGQRFPGRIDRGEVRLDLRMRPGVNRLSGLVDQSVGGTLSGRWQHDKLTLRISGGASQSVPTSSPSAFRSILGDIGAGYQVSKALLVEVGARGSSQHQFQQTAANAAPVPDLLTGVVYVAVTIQAPAMRF
jgi:hypothetical protein